MAWGLRFTRHKAAVREPNPPDSPPAAPERRATASVLHTVGTHLTTLRQKLLDLYGARVPRDQFAAQAAELIVKALNAAAGALLVYEQRRNRLVLLGSTGLDPEACEALGGAQGAPGWDIPMRGLANRRISVIEAAQQNPFVPRPLIAVSPRRLTIATLPFFHGQAPAGVLVLFADKPRAFGDTQLQTVAQALKVCALAFAELPRTIGSRPVDAEASGPAPAEPVLTQRDSTTEGQPLADAQELARLRTAFDEALWRHAKELAETRRATAEAVNAEREQIASIKAAVAAVEAERDRLASQLAATRNDLATFADTRAALDAHGAEVARLRETLAQVTTDAERTATRLADLQRAHAELISQHEAALRQHADQEKGSTAAIATLREQISVVEAEGARLREALGQTRKDLGTSREQLSSLEAQLAQREAARSALAAQQAELRAAYDTVRERATGAEQAAARLQKRLDEQLAALTSERGDLSQELARATATVEELHVALAAAQSERDANAAEAAQSASRLADVEQTLAQLHAASHAAAMTAQREREQLIAELHGWRESEPEWARKLEKATERADAAEAEQARLSEALAHLETTLGRSTDESAQQLRALEQATESLRSQHDDLEKRYGALEAAHVTLQRERDELATLAENLRAEHQRAVSEHSATITEQAGQVKTLQAQLLEAVSRYESDVGKRSSKAARLAQERDATTAKLRSLEQKLADQSERTRQLEQELAASGQHRNHVQEELQEVAARYDRDTTALHSQLAELAGNVERERAAHGDELNRLTREWESERSTLRARAAELEEELERTRSEHLALARALAADESEPALEIERCIIPGADDAADEMSDEPIDRAVADATSYTVAVLDGDGGAAMVAELAQAGWDAVAYEPTDAAIEQLSARAPAAIAVNVLAGHNGWQLVRSLRDNKATGAVPLLLYAKQTDAAGFCFGPADCVLWPGGSQRILDALVRLAPRAKRVLAMSTDIDIVAGVREQLTGAGLSAAVMLDGKQALDLLPSVRPDAIVLHLSPSCVDIFRTVGGLRTNPAAAALPIVFLMDQAPTGRDATFLTGGARTLAAKGKFSCSGIVEAMAQILPLEPSERPEPRGEARFESGSIRAASGGSDHWVG
jgi:DNA-binding response OmpR family regulator/predicted  nucleic acid-binding Zn-ribbon protein